MKNPYDTDDVNELRTMVEDLQAYSQMMDLTFESRLQDAISEREQTIKDEAYGPAFDEGYDAGREQAVKDFNKHIEEVREKIDETLDLHMSDYTD